MTTYLQFHEDNRGDLVDLSYWHGFCAPAEVRALGAWPCPESVDYTVYCLGCNERVFDVGLTDEGLVSEAERGWDEANLSDWEKDRAITNGWILDRYGRDWGPRMPCEACPECGQPDNTAECSHGRLTVSDVLTLGGALAR